MSKWDSANDSMRKQIDAVRIMAGLTPDKVSRIMALSRAAYYRKMEDPGLFRIEELRRLEPVANQVGISIFSTMGGRT